MSWCSGLSFPSVFFPDFFFFLLTQNVKFATQVVAVIWREIQCEYLTVVSHWGCIFTGSLWVRVYKAPDLRMSVGFQDVIFGMSFPGYFGRTT